VPREHAFRHAALANRLADHLAHEFAGAGMGGMGFDDDGISPCQRGRGISSGHGEGQREIAGAEYHDRTQGTEHGPNIGPGSGFAIRIGAIDAPCHPRSLLCDLREQSKLRAGASGFTLQTGRRQSSLLTGALDDLTGNGFDFRRNHA